MKKLFFTVVVCTYNRVKLLPRALKSLQKQTFKDFEVIVVDDGSKDRTQAMLKEFKEKTILNLRIFKVPHQGLGKARQFGLLKAKGQYTTFLDSDDRFLKDHLLSRYEFIRKYPKVDLFYNGFKTIGSKMVPDLFNKGKFLHVDDPVIFHTATMVVKTKKALKVGGFTKITTANYPDNFMEVAKKNKFTILRVKKRTYVYYRTLGSLTYEAAK